MEEFDQGDGGWYANRISALPVWDGVAYCYSPWFLDPNHAPPGAGYLHLVMWLFTDGRMYQNPRVLERVPYTHNSFVEQGFSTRLGNSRITPVEGAHFLGVPNIIFIRYHDRPEPPFQQYAIPFKSLERVVWSITGASGLTSPEERQHVLSLAQDMPNLTGVFMDDFFHFEVGRPLPDGQPLAAITVAQLHEFRKQMGVASRRLDLGVTLYTHQLDERILPHLELCDSVSLWTWRAPELANLETNFAKYEKLVPSGKKRLLGLYMWDFGNRRPLPLESMKMQCTQALRWLHEGRIDGMIFLATNICDLNLETVEWSRRWIAEHGDEPLQVRQDAGQ